MTSAFDPQTFLDAQTTEVNTKRPPIPTENPEDSNGLYTALIGEIKTDAGTIGKGERIGQPWVSMLIPLKLQIPSSIQAQGIPQEITLTDRAFLDLTASGAIDNSPGKNRRQKDYREATDLNKPGEPFAWRMLSGRVVKVKVSHELYEGEIVERISQILKA